MTVIPTEVAMHSEKRCGRGAQWLLAGWAHLLGSNSVSSSGLHRVLDKLAVLTLSMLEFPHKVGEGTALLSGELDG